MKILGIVGSHRRLGNTDCLVKEALLGSRKKEIAALRARYKDS